MLCIWFHWSFTKSTCWPEDARLLAHEASVVESKGIQRRKHMFLKTWNIRYGIQKKQSSQTCSDLEIKWGPLTSGTSSDFACCSTWPTTIGSIQQYNSIRHSTSQFLESMQVVCNEPCLWMWQAWNLYFIWLRSSFLMSKALIKCSLAFCTKSYSTWRPRQANRTCDSRHSEKHLYTWPVLWYDLDMCWSETRAVKRLASFFSFIPHRDAVIQTFQLWRRRQMFVAAFRNSSQNCIFWRPKVKLRARSMTIFFAIEVLLIPCYTVVQLYLIIQYSSQVSNLIAEN